MNKKPNSKIATLYVILWYTVYIIYILYYINILYVYIIVQNEISGVSGHGQVAGLVQELVASHQHSEHSPRRYRAGPPKPIPEIQKARQNTVTRYHKFQHLMYFITSNKAPYELHPLEVPVLSMRISPSQQPAQTDFQLNWLTTSLSHQHKNLSTDGEDARGCQLLFDQQKMAPARNEVTPLPSIGRCKRSAAALVQKSTLEDHTKPECLRE